MTKIVLIRGHRTVVPKGLIEVLTERGCYRQKMKVDEMRAVIALHPDFKAEKCKLENFLASRGHSCQFLPKYHCELNAIERLGSSEETHTGVLYHGPQAKYSHSTGQGIC